MDSIWEILTPLNGFLTIIIGVLTWKLFGPKRSDPEIKDTRKILPKMKRKDFTLEDLREYDGVNHDGRILTAVNGTVFDVTRGSNFYGPGGPYSAFAGRDASRMLATFNLNPKDDPLKYDDLSDLKSSEMEQVKEWYLQFCEKYDKVGRLLKPGEDPTDYEDEAEEVAEPNANIPSSSPSPVVTGSGDK